MRNTLLHEFIAALTAPERRSAEKWLRSPLHNSREDLLHLYQVLLKNEEAPDRKLVWEQVYLDEAFDDQRFRLTCSYLLQSLEGWLRWYEWQQTAQLDPYLLTAFRHRSLEKHYLRHERKHRQALARSTWRNQGYHWRQYQLEEEYYRYLSRAGRGQLLNFPAQEQALQRAFMSHKLRLACLSIANQRVGGDAYDIALLPEILTLAAQSEYQQLPAIAVYYHAYRMYDNVTDEAAFRAFEALLLQHLPQFPSREGRDLVLLGINFCIRQINRRGNAYFKEALALYRQGLEQGILLEDGYLSPFTFSNITIIALRSDELAWTANFLESYRHQLEPHRREAIYALNAARLAYHQGRHREALLLLHQFSDRDFIHQLSAKIIQLKIYFENDDHQLLGAHIKNTRAYLRRITTDSYHKQIYSNIFSLADQLRKLPPYDKTKREALRQQIQTTEPLTEREWLLAQL